MDEVNTFLEKKFQLNSKDIDLKIDEIRNSRISVIAQDIKYLGMFLKEIFKSCHQQYDSEYSGVTGSTAINIKFLDEITKQKDELVESKIKEKFFVKSVNSIKNKLYRKLDVDKVDIVLDTFHNHINDLFRDSIICSNYNSVEMVISRLKGNIDAYLPKRRNDQGELQDDTYNFIEKITVDEESKMNNGYFAYHVHIYLKSSIIIEFQVFSELTSHWRDISHKLYEKQRVGKSVNTGAGKAYTRLISLGHTLHIIDCEVQRIIKELKNEQK